MSSTLMPPRSESASSWQETSARRRRGRAGRIPRADVAAARAKNSLPPPCSMSMPMLSRNGPVTFLARPMRDVVPRNPASATTTRQSSQQVIPTFSEDGMIDASELMAMSTGFRSGYRRFPVFGFDSTGRMSPK